MPRVHSPSVTSHLVNLTIRVVGRGRVGGGYRAHAKGGIDEAHDSPGLPVQAPDWKFKFLENTANP